MLMKWQLVLAKLICLVSAFTTDCIIRFSCIVQTVIMQLNMTCFSIFICFVEYALCLLL